jgi:hypothetical protein
MRDDRVSLSFGYLTV